jgi:hypothetical protein
MKKTWTKPVLCIEAASLEVTSYSSADLDPEFLF